MPGLMQHGIAGITLAIGSAVAIETVERNPRRYITQATRVKIISGQRSLNFVRATKMRRRFVSIAILTNRIGRRVTGKIPKVWRAPSVVTVLGPRM